MPTSTLTRHGQVTIPKKIRQRLGLEAGVRLRIEVDSRGGLRLIPEVGQPPATRSRLPGLLHHLARSRPISIEEMHDAVAEEAAERFRRSTAK